MVLIDTSAWVHFLRPDGDADVRQRVEVALRAGLARWCPIVRLELWNGAGGDRERKLLREFERVVPELPLTPEVWTHAYTLARSCRAAGASVPASDLLIMACAHHHGTDLIHADADFDQIVDTASGETRPGATLPRRR
jgi:predicted nucleic acid-binding protein